MGVDFRKSFHPERDVDKLLHGILGCMMVTPPLYREGPYHLPIRLIICLLITHFFKFACWTNKRLHQEWTIHSCLSIRWSCFEAVANWGKHDATLHGLWWVYLRWWLFLHVSNLTRYPAMAVQSQSGAYASLLVDKILPFPWIFALILYQKLFFSRYDV